LGDALYSRADNEQFAEAVEPLIQAYEELHEARLTAESPEQVERGE
jgi:hypothetical protein